MRPTRPRRRRPCCSAPRLTSPRRPGSADRTFWFPSSTPSNDRRCAVSADRPDPFATLEEAAGRQAREHQAGRALTAARVKLILGRDAKSAFFATLALRLAPEPAWDLDTMSTD